VQHLADYGRGIRSQHNADSRSTDDQQLGRLKQDPRIAFFQEESAENGGKDHEDAE
jgi:hypothetical protein